MTQLRFRLRHPFYGRYQTRTILGAGCPCREASSRCCQSNAEGLATVEFLSRVRTGYFAIHRSVSIHIFGQNHLRAESSSGRIHPPVSRGTPSSRRKTLTCSKVYPDTRSKPALQPSSFLLLPGSFASVLRSQNAVLKCPKNGPGSHPSRFNV